MADGNNLGYPESHIPHHGTSELTPIYEALDHDGVAIFPIWRSNDLRRVRLILLDDYDAKARSLVHGLDYIGWPHRVLGTDGVAIHNLGFGDRDADRLRDALGLHLVHG